MPIADVPFMLYYAFFMLYYSFSQNGKLKKVIFFLILPKKKMLRLIDKLLGLIAVVFAISFYGCDLMEEMIDYSPYDVDVKGERNINAKNCVRIE